MRDRQGGIIGATVTPTTSAASGVWTLREAERFRRGGIWPARPGAPTSLVGTAGNTQVSLTWTAPTSNGGSAITGYVVEYTPSGGSASTVSTGSTSASYTVTGLTNGTAYTFRVAAVTGVGAGAYSTASDVTPSAYNPNLPSTISGLQLWLDASDSSTLYNATSGGSLVDANGTVARWQDKSGNSRHVTQSTSGARPTRKTSVQNGLDTIRFDGSATYMTQASSTSTFAFLHQAQQSAVYFVVSFGTSNDPNAAYGVIGTGAASSASTDVGYFIEFDDRVSASRNNGILASTVNTDGSRPILHGASNVITPQTFVAIQHLIDGGNSNASSRSLISVNGTSVGGSNSNTSTASGVAASFDLCIGAIPSSSGNFAPMNGDIAEILVFNVQPSSADQAALVGYLKSKWGIA